MNIRKNWNRQELLLAFGLYCQMPFGKMHSRNPIIIRAARLLGRTPSALAMKLTNIASIDPKITSTGRKGLSGASNADKEMWEEMHNNWESFMLESSEALNDLASDESGDSTYIESHIGRMKTVKAKARIGQNFFRESVLSAYNNACCICGLSMPKLLVASHIIPWHVDTLNRLNPRNGLCLSMLHDKALDTGIIAIQEDMTIMISKRIKSKDDFYKNTIECYEGKEISRPEKFQPDLEFLAYHRNNIFQR